MKNIYRFDGDVCFIDCETPRHGKVTATIDASDYNRVKNFHWCPTNSGEHLYFRTHFRVFDGGKTKVSYIKLHRLIASFPLMDVDHIDGNTLNNSQSNLRQATRAENNKNAKCTKETLSKTKGVGIYKTRKGIRFRATLRTDKKRFHLGVFDSLNEAKDAYDKAAIEHFGEFARTHKESA
jgi:hypothetical protein